MNSQNIMFALLAVFVVLSSIATVVTKSIIRAATYLLFVLLGTAGLYFLMGYTFLGAVQVMVYAGGIIVLYVFSILLTSGRQESLRKSSVVKVLASAALSFAGFVVFLLMLFKQNLFANVAALDAPVEATGAADSNSIQQIGHFLLSSSTGGYLLPFEAVSVLLLACIVAGLLIARKY